MHKKIIKTICPILMITIAVGSYLFTRNNTLAKRENISIKINEMPLKNTIDIVQVKTLEGLENITKLFYYDGDSNIIFGMNRHETDSSTSNNTNKSQEYYRNLGGDIYYSSINSTKPKMLKANNLSLKSLDVEIGAGFSPNGKLVDFSTDEGFYMFDIDNDTVKKYSDDYIDGNWSEDSRYIIKYGRSKTTEPLSTESMFFIYDINGTLKKKIPLPSNVNWVDISHDFYSEDGDSIYFLGRSLEDNILKTALFKLDFQDESIQTVLSYLHEKREKIKNPGTDLKEHPGDFIEVVTQSRIYNFSFLRDNLILYTASVDSINGLYIYNLDSKTSSQLLNYDGNLNFSIAPDGQKIIYSLSKRSKSNTHINNIYVANIKGSSIDDITLVKEDCNIYDFQWSTDSKEVLGFDPDKSSITSIKFK